jgi:EAL domain-containing protein (putative c-di-GMP-specific phosphodiesterase class I)/GGDEF domain-containing protein/PAS domain-containing protein
MAELSAVPMLVLARTQDFVAVINSTLRNAGLAAHCTWISETKDLADGFTKSKAEMLLAFVGAEPAELKSILQIRDQAAPGVPVIAVRERIDEEIIAIAMQMGARDVVTLASRARLQAVVSREVNAYRTQRELANTKTSAQQHKAQIKAIMADTGDAIAYVQDGIVVDANQAWLELFGLKSADALVGHPLMDSLQSDAHAAFKAAVSACLQGKWGGQTLRANAVLPNRSLAPFECILARAEFDGDPAVRLSVPVKMQVEAAEVKEPPKPEPVKKPEVKAPPSPEPVAAKVEPAAKPTPPPMIDVSTGFLQRRPFNEQILAALAKPLKGGVRQIVAIEPDDFAAIAEQLGPLSIDEFVGQFAAVLAESFKPGDIVGRLGDCMFVAMLERGTTRDVEAWSTSAIAKVGSHVFHAAGKSIMTRCSIGIGMVDLRARDANTPVVDALQARREAVAQGGNRFSIIDRSDEDTRQQASDAIWVRLIKSALMDNRFKLMQQPIANLLGGERGMFDVLVRMIDESGEDILPSEFIAAAERNELIKNIDRWVVSSSMTVCAARPVQRLFVRLSKDSVCDKSLVPWLALQVKSTRVEPARIAFQVTEQVAAEYISDTAALASAVRQAGFKFALEHFGSGRESLRLLAHIPADYLKVDGTLMQSLATDNELQQRVKELVDGARARRISTIAERVEDANTMAVLWQLGIEYIQGYFVNEPEQVVMGG